MERNFLSLFFVVLLVAAGIELAPAKEPCLLRLETAYENTEIAGESVDLQRYRASEKDLADFRAKHEDPESPWPKNGWDDVPIGYGYPPKKARRLAYAEYRAIREYGNGDANYAWNRALRSKDAKRIKQYRTEIKTLASALNRLRGHVGQVYRHANLEAEILAKFSPGEIHTERGFLSTSMKKGDVVEAYNTYFEIRSKGGGKSISGMTFYNESEVLFSPGKRFHVVSKTRETITHRYGSPGGTRQEYWLIVMEEL